jgi:hypothetical protein
LAVDIKGEAEAMNEWSVELEAMRPRGVKKLDLADEIIDALGNRGPAVSFVGDRVSVRFDVEAPTPFDAFAVARDVVLNDLKLEPIRAAVESVKDVERYVRTSNAPDLVGVAEAAKLLGVSRQRISELAGQTAFPAPLAKLAAGPVWTTAAVKRFTDTWKRRPGRPAAAAATPAP